MKLLLLKGCSNLMYFKSIFVFLFLIFIQSNALANKYRDKAEQRDPYVQMHNGISEDNIKKIKKAMSRGLSLDTYAHHETFGANAVQLCIKFDCTVKTLKWLLENGASSNKYDLDLDTQKWREKDLLVRLIELDKSPDLIAYIKGEEYESDMRQQAPTSSSSERNLRKAIIEKEDYELAKKLLEKGADINGIVEKKDPSVSGHGYGLTMLHECIDDKWGCSDKSIEFLIKNGADTSKMIWDGRDGKQKWDYYREALELSMHAQRSIEIQKLLVDYSRREGLKSTLFQTTTNTYHDNVELIKVIVEKDPSLLEETHRGRTPYLTAVEDLDINAIRYYIAERGIPVNQKYQDEGVLVFLAENGNRHSSRSIEDVIDELIGFGADVNQVRKKDSKTWVKVLEENFAISEKVSSIMDSREAGLVSAEEQLKSAADRKKRERREFWADLIGAAAKSMNESSISSSYGGSGRNLHGSTDPIGQTYNQAMTNIRAIENNALQQKQLNSTQNIKPSSTPTAISPNRTATLISAPTDPLDAEKQNCINAGKKWQAGGSCDYSSSVTIQGWSQDKATESATGSNSRNSPSTTGSVSASAMSEIQNTTRDQSQLSSQAATSNSTSSGTSEGQPRLTMIVVREESYNSWSTQEVACDYAKNQVIRRAKKQCETDYKGEPATTADIPIPIDANCQSYRQMTKSNIGEWAATGNVTFYCRH